jgi:hypothetical protein
MMRSFPLHTAILAPFRDVPHQQYRDAASPQKEMKPAPGLQQSATVNPSHNRYGSKTANKTTPTRPPQIFGRLVPSRIILCGVLVYFRGTADLSFLPIEPDAQTSMDECAF